MGNFLLLALLLDSGPVGFLDPPFTGHTSDAAAAYVELRTGDHPKLRYH